MRYLNAFEKPNDDDEQKLPFLCNIWDDVSILSSFSFRSPISPIQMGNQPQKEAKSELIRASVSGLDAAGKSTILSVYADGIAHVDVTVPTIGFCLESVNAKDFSFLCWDVGGCDKIRPPWLRYLDDTHCLVFVVDCNDRDREVEARDELHKLLSHDGLRNCPLLVCGNKQDIPGAMGAAYLADALGLNALGIQWHIQLCCAISGDGIHDGFRWLRDAVRFDEMADPLSVKEAVEEGR